MHTKKSAFIQVKEYQISLNINLAIHCIGSSEMKAEMYGERVAASLLTLFLLQS